MKNPKFKKGDFILTELEFPAVVYENQRSNDYISIYAFGLFDEWGSEYPDKAKKITEEEFFVRCANRGYDRSYVINQLKGFKLNLS